MAGRLTTHVLDTAQGCPAGGLMIELWRLDSEGTARQLLKTVRTNADGRTDGPLLADDLTAGAYELVFAVGAYFASDWAVSKCFFNVGRVSRARAAVWPLASDSFS